MKEQPASQPHYPIGSKSPIVDNGFAIQKHILEGSVFWLPRIFSLAIPVLMAFLAFHVINDGGGLLQTTAALVIQFIPVLVVAIVLVFAWEWDWVGAILFSAFAVCEFILEWTIFPTENYQENTILFVPAGLLFLISWVYFRLRRKRKDQGVM